MPRIRSIKPDFWNDEKLGQEPEAIMLTFIGLWNFADDYAVVRANPNWLKNQIYPYKATLRLEAFSTWLARLIELEAIILLTYRGESFYFIRTFRKHQVVNRPSKVRHIPEKELMEILHQNGYKLGVDGEFIKHSLSTHCELTEYSVQDKDIGRDIGREGKTRSKETSVHLETQKSELNTPGAENLPPPVARPPSYNAPTLEEVKTKFPGMGGTEVMAEKFWNKYEGLGWKIGISPILNWRSIANNFIANYKESEERDGDKTNSGGNKSPAGGKAFNGRNGGFTIVADLLRNEINLPPPGGAEDNRSEIQI